MEKTAQLQIRVSRREKARLKRLAAAAGQDVSAYVLSRALGPAPGERFAEVTAQLLREEDHRYALAELHDLLAGLAPMEYAVAVAPAPPAGLSPFLANYVAAMVEHAAVRSGVRPPDWVRTIAPLDEPVFAAPQRSVRMYLLRSAPPAFKRRNIFVDATVGARV